MIGWDRACEPRERNVTARPDAHMALHDPLTGLPDRALPLDRLGQALAQAQRRCGMVAVFPLDPDGQKEINDTLGHPAGDQILCGVARRVTAAIRSRETFARLGGDEFPRVQPRQGAGSRSSLPV